MWLPLALALIFQKLTFIASAYAKEGTMRVPKLSEVLSSFALPAMAEAMAKEERSQKDQDFVDSLLALAKRTGGKVEIKK